MAHETCSNDNLFHKQVVRIKKVMCWGGYPCYIRNKINKLLKNKKNTKNTDTLEQEDIATIFCRKSYLTVQGEKPIKNLI